MTNDKQIEKQRETSMVPYLNIVQNLLKFNAEKEYQDALKHLKYIKDQNPPLSPTILYQAHFLTGLTYEGQANLKYKLDMHRFGGGFSSIHISALEYENPLKDTLLNNAIGEYNSAIYYYTNIPDKTICKKQKEIESKPYLFIAKNYLILENYGEARNSIVKLINISPPSNILYTAYVILGKAFSGEKKDDFHDDAIVNYEESLKHTTSCSNIAISYQNIGNVYLQEAAFMLDYFNPAPEFDTINGEIIKDLVTAYKYYITSMGYVNVDQTSNSELKQEIETSITNIKTTLNDIQDYTIEASDGATKFVDINNYIEKYGQSLGLTNCDPSQKFN